MRTSILLACMLLLNPWAVHAQAGTAQGFFSIRINLSNPTLTGSGTVGNAQPNPAFCINQAFSQSTNAQVTVTCSGNQFVSITPQAGMPYQAGTHGGAYRLLFEPTTLVSQNDPLWQMGLGTVTTVRILKKDRREETVELLVSF